MQPTITQLISTHSTALSATSDSPRLDIELLIMHCCNLTREALFTHPHYTPTQTQRDCITRAVERRRQGEPIAYLIGYKPFWNAELVVTPDVLIPRPETEHLIEWALNTFSEKDTLTVADLGVGSGAIAISLASEKPHWAIHATDASKQALHVAQQNAKKIALNNIHFFQGHWLQALPDKNYDLIISNPPYIRADDPHLKNLRFEPIDALISGKDGLDAIRDIIQTAPPYLKPGGYLAFEHGFDQAEQVQQLLRDAQYNNIETHHDLADLPRFTIATRV